MKNVVQQRWYILGGVVVAAILFQLFFRYQYVHLAGAEVMRIDRLTGRSCYEPCIQPRAVPSEMQQEIDAELIDYMNRAYSENYSAGASWVIVSHYDEAGNQETKTNGSKAGVEASYTTRLTCHCEEKRSGLECGSCYEVKPVFPGSFSAMIVNGNSVLEKKYGFAQSTPPPGYKPSKFPTGFVPEPDAGPCITTAVGRVSLTSCPPFSK
jgi:hypothetical protein